MQNYISSKLKTNTNDGRKRLIGILLFIIILALFFSFNRLPKLDIVGEDLSAVTSPGQQCFQGFCIEREEGTSFISKWVTFSTTYLRLVTVGMTFAFVIAGLSEAFIFPPNSTRGFESGSWFSRTIKGAAAGPVMNLCSACIVPVSSAFHRRAGVEGALGMVQGSATMNIPALSMVFFVFNPLLGLSRLILAVVGALTIPPLVALTIKKEPQQKDLIDIVENNTILESILPWKTIFIETLREWSKITLGYLTRMGPIMIVAGFASGLAIQWLNPGIVNTYLGNNLLGLAIAATFGILINVPLLFEIPLVALLLLLGMGTAPAATLLFTAAAAGPVTFWGLAGILPKKSIASFAISTWIIGFLGGLIVLGVGTILWKDTQPLKIQMQQSKINTYSDITETSGVNFTTNSNLQNYNNTGIIILDFDNDSFEDIYIINGEGPNELFHNQGDKSFLNVTKSSNTYDINALGTGGCAADYDNDGDEDIFVTNQGQNTLFKNNGDGTFSKTKTNILNDNSHSIGCAWGDINNDGWLDLIYTNHTNNPVNSIKLFINTKNNEFEEFNSIKNDLTNYINNNLKILQPALIDINSDNNLDVVIIYKNLNTNTLNQLIWINQIQTLNNQKQINLIFNKEFLLSPEFDQKSRVKKIYFGNNIVISETGEVNLINNPILATFFRHFKIGWGAINFDYNNDGYDDIFISKNPPDYDQESNNSNQLPIQLSINEDIEKFSPILTENIPSDNTQINAVAYSDLDLDGCLDIVVSPYKAPLKIFHNSCKSQNNWLNLKLEGKSINKNAIGAQIHISTENGTQIKNLNTNVGQASQSSSKIHFGLGESKSIKSLTVFWPNGKISEYKNIDVNQHLSLSEPRE